MWVIHTSEKALAPFKLRQNSITTNNIIDHLYSGIIPRIIQLKKEPDISESIFFHIRQDSIFSLHLHWLCRLRGRPLMDRPLPDSWKIWLDWGQCWLGRSRTLTLLFFNHSTVALDHSHVQIWIYFPASASWLWAAGFPEALVNVFHRPILTGASVPEEKKHPPK